MSEPTAKTLMHVDLCHAYCWVVREPDGTVLLTFDEREGSDLYLHKRADCARCRDLRQINARPRHTTREIPDYDEHKDDPKMAFAVVLAVIGEEDERGERVR